MNYAHKEFPFAKAFADALEMNDAFKAWVLSQTKFHECANESRLLAREMLAARSKGTLLYWNSHYHHQCSCDGCSGKHGRTGKPKKGRETDVLAVFESPICQFPIHRFALHVEVKRPGDSFDDSNQAPAYGMRAKCWATPGKTPSKVLPHSDSATLVLFSEGDRSRFLPDLQHFDREITFETIRKKFPEAAYSEPCSAN
jgi:hypothetical protein